MDVAHQLALVLVALILVLLNGFFVASEFSIVKVRPTRIQELAQKGSAKAVRARTVIGKLDEYYPPPSWNHRGKSRFGLDRRTGLCGAVCPLFIKFGRLQPVLSHSLASSLAFITITFLHIVMGNWRRSRSQSRERRGGALELCSFAVFLPRLLSFHLGPERDSQRLP